MVLGVVTQFARVPAEAGEGGKGVRVNAGDRIGSSFRSYPIHSRFRIGRGTTRGPALVSYQSPSW
jgi:hypothetical protein